MSYTIIALVVAVGTSILGNIFMFSSATLLKQRGLPSSVPVQVIARRLGAVYLGIASLLLLSITSIPTTIAMAIGTAAMSALLALTGLVELRAGRVNKGIIRSIVIELLLSIGLLSTLL